MNCEVETGNWFLPVPVCVVRWSGQPGSDRAPPLTALYVQCDMPPPRLCRLSSHHTQSSLGADPSLKANI